ncbi:hypothetical protein LPJ56_005250, partial [Coemansia sp. RSA 2599]
SYSGKYATPPSPLPLPTGGTARVHPELSSPSYSVSLVPTTSFDAADLHTAATTTSSSAASAPRGGYVDGVPETFPRLRALGAPGRTVPQMPKENSESAEGGAGSNGVGIGIGMMSSARPSLVRFPLLPPNLQQRHHLSAVNLLRHSISRSKSTGGIAGSQAMPGSPTNPSTGIAYPIQPLPSFFRRRTTMAATRQTAADNDDNDNDDNDNDVDSTVVDSRLALPPAISLQRQARDSDHAVVPRDSAISARTTVSRASTSKSAADDESSDILTIMNTSSRIGNRGASSSTGTGTDSDGDGKGAGALRARSSFDTTTSFFSDDLPELAPYVDPYRALDLPAQQLFSSDPGADASGNALMAAAPPVAVSTAPMADKQLLRMASESLRAMLREILLDRERLEFIHEGLVLGGVTAATIWYSLPWLHFELLQYDDARQRLIAMLLAFSHTCPPDVIRYFDLSLPDGDGCSLAGAHDVSEESILRRMAAEDRAEYEAIVAGSLDSSNSSQEGGVVAFTPSQAWRFVIRP